MAYDDKIAEGLSKILAIKEKKDVRRLE